MESDPIFSFENLIKESLCINKCKNIVHIFSYEAEFMNAFLFYLNFYGLNVTKLSYLNYTYKKTGTITPGGSWPTCDN